MFELKVINNEVKKEGSFPEYRERIIADQCSAALPTVR
jgi:hypothetical protein